MSAGKLSDLQIKMEGTELQTYLESFNKEIEGGDQQTITVVQAEDSDEGDDDGEAGTYFVDQTGNYYYQATKDSEPILTAPPEDDEETQFISGDADPIDTSEVNKNNDFQAVTIVQSENNPGEVSYVLIMEDQQEDKGENENEEQDPNVYEFDENEEQKPEYIDAYAEDDKTKIVKLVSKKSQSAPQIHMCNYCNYTSPKRYLLSRHMKSHSEERPHKCSVCERGFKTLASLQNHVNTHTGTKPHHCKFCESAFTTSGELVRHVRYRHTHEKPHKCKECDYASVELSKLKRHIRCHTGERPYQCPHCTYASPDTFKLKRHLRIHTGEKPYECDVCHARFTQSNSLKAHKLIHSVGDKPVFHCELCPTTCGRKTDLRIHVQKLHTSDKPLRCKRCGNAFPDRYSYKIHAKTHEGEKCYKCELCPYASISARHLESHMLIHTDQKPFNCEQCDQSFRQKQLLKRHINLYHNPDYVPPTPKEKTHACPNCDRVFRHKGNLIRHMAQHDPDSAIRQEAMALKVGRQKRIQIIDGQKVEIMSDMESDEFEGEEDDVNEDEGTEGNELMAMEGEDGQYVVLEVIQVDEDGGEENNESNPLEDIEEEDYLISEDIDEEVLRNLHGRKLKADPDDDATGKEMSNCFGFDEGDDESNDGEMSMEMDETHHKSTIKLIDIQE